MPDATRNRIISTPEPLGVSGDSHLHEGASRGHLWHEAEAQKNFQKTSPERFRAKENGIISPKGNPHGEPKTFGQGHTDDYDEPLFSRRNSTWHANTERVSGRSETAGRAARTKAAQHGSGDLYCAANMAALMVTYDDGRYVCDIGFRKAPADHPQLLGIVGAPGSGFSTTREIGKSLVLDVLYGAIEPADVRLLSDDQATDIEGKDSSLRGTVEEQEPGEALKFFVTYEGKQYEVVRKFMQRKLSFAEPAEREATQKLIEKYKADQARVRTHSLVIART